VRYVRAEGVAMGEAKKAEALDSAALQLKAATRKAANQDQAAIAA